MSGKITILIVEDDYGWTKIITNSLNKEEDFIVVGAVNNKKLAIDTAFVLKPNIILMDLKLMDSLSDGIEATLEITKKIQTNIIMLTNFEDRELIQQAWEAGAKDYVFKDRINLLSGKIRDVFFDKSPIVVALQELEKYKKESEFSKLSPAEKEILSLLKKGFKIEEIGKRLCKTDKTVYNQKSSAIRKLRLNSLEEVLEGYNEFIQ